VTIDGDHTSVEDIVGSFCIHRRDIQCLNNFIMDIIIICPEMRCDRGDEKFDEFIFYVYVEKTK
jgi:hypothetical protein